MLYKILILLFISSVAFGQFTSDHTGNHIDSVITGVEDIVNSTEQGGFVINSNSEVDVYSKDATRDTLGINEITISLIDLYESAEAVLHYFDVAITIDSIKTVTADSAITFYIAYSDSFGGTYTSIFFTNKEVTNTTTGNTLSTFENATIPINNFMKVFIPAMDGETSESLYLKVYY